MNACCYCVRFSFFPYQDWLGEMSLKWPILVEWDVKPQLNQSTVTVMAYVVFECLKCLLALLMMLRC